jgi:hypothetical protein
VARVKWNTTSIRYIDSMWSNTEEWQAIRKAPALEAMFMGLGESWVDRLNTELHNAQAARKQPVADGYKYAIRRDEDRLRMYIWAFTARAMAHEAAHQSILRLMRTSGFETNERGRAKFGGSRRSSGGSGRGSRSGGGKGSAGPGPSRPRSAPPKRPTLDPQTEAKMRRRLITLDRLSANADSSDPNLANEGKLAREKARRIRDELGE